MPIAKEVFEGVLGSNRNQTNRLREDVDVSAKDLLDLRVPGGAITEAGLRNNVGVAIQYLESWLRGIGAVTISHLMEDTATAEIARSQVWQWLRNHAHLKGGRRVTRDLVRRIEDEEVARIRESIGDDAFSRGRFQEARALFDETALTTPFIEFLTLSAYDAID